MKVMFITMLITTLLCPVSACFAGELFTDEAAILAISREDQTNALKTGRLKRELTLSAAITVLTTYRSVTQERFLIFAHQPGVSGKLILKNGKAYTWTIEPDYAATLKGPGGETIYLLHPKLDIKPAPMERGRSQQE